MGSGAVFLQARSGEIIRIAKIEILVIVIAQQNRESIYFVKIINGNEVFVDKVVLQ